MAKSRDVLYRSRESRPSRESMLLTANCHTDQAHIPVAVCHRDPLLRLGLVASLREVRRFDLQVLDSLDDILRWRAMAGDEGVAVCDYDAGTAVAEYARHRQGRIPVMVVTHRDKETDIQGALAQGVLGYLMVGCRPEEVVDGVLALTRGQRILSASAAQRVADRICYDVLTPREEEVLRFVAAGWTNKMVANRLGVSEGTVKSHVRAILDKLAVRTRTEAANVAMRRGLVGAHPG